MEYVQEGILIVNLKEYLFIEARHSATIAPSVFQMSCFSEQLFSVMYT